MTIIVTGFEPFGPEPINPSQEIVKALKESQPEFVYEVLATEYDFSGIRIRQLIDEHTPHLVLMLGLSEATLQTKLERVALNIDDAGSADNSGDLRTGQSIREAAPLALKTGIDLRQIQSQMHARSHDVVISNHAGVYVCNHIFYCALDHVATHGLTTQCLFVHVPPLREDVPGQTIEYLVSTIENLISILSET